MNFLLTVSPRATEHCLFVRGRRRGAGRGRRVRAAVHSGHVTVHGGDGREVAVHWRKRHRDGRRRCHKVRRVVLQPQT